MNNSFNKKLNLGSGELKKEGFINVDRSSLVAPDVVHDLNILPYPFNNDEFDLIEADHVLEHLDNVFFVMAELHRILKLGGELKIKVPHFSRGFTHAEHSHGFDITFPLYFNKNFTKSGYYGVEFKLEKFQLHWLAFFHLLPALGYGGFILFVLKFFNAVISFLANLAPGFCSRIWCFWVGGFDEIEFKFICKK